MFDSWLVPFMLGFIAALAVIMGSVACCSRADRKRLDGGVDHWSRRDYGRPRIVQAGDTPAPLANGGRRR